VSQDAAWMALALQLAEKGLYSTSPNPRVACVLVRDGVLLSQGWHQQAGGPHAEVVAIRATTQSLRGATAYVTLEPCSHFGRTPPCALALIEAGVSRVVVAMQDPNPLVAGRGVAMLRDAGIQVESGLMADIAAHLNRGFVQRMLQQRPWVTLKLGMSLDARTALASGESQWITSAQARADVQHWRARSCAIMTGIGTVLQDNPSLNVRDFEVLRQPYRVVLDRQLRTPVAARIRGPGCWIYQSHQASALLPDASESIFMPDDEQFLPSIMSDLARRGCNEVLVEAGPTLAGALLERNLVDQLLVYQAPLCLGSAARPAFYGLDLDTLLAAQRWSYTDVRQIGPDLRLILEKN
jgi:diaminohydroxyphosphoribosylaminopyrimidine deaminase / 5-amino-6-(5-phosphoribosylamino)uracil reductase